jgi:hypothetical protein
VVDSRRPGRTVHKSIVFAQPGEKRSLSHWVSGSAELSRLAIADQFESANAASRSAHTEEPEPGPLKAAG